MDEADWAITEFGGASLGDSRRTDRLVRAATLLGAQPQASLPDACGDAAQLKGLYRLLENPAVTPTGILSGHVQATLERLQPLPVVLAVQDTTELDYSQRHAATGLGAIGNGFGRGLEVHSTLAIGLDGTPLGVLAQDVWARPPEQTGKKHRRKQRPLREKESEKWLRSLAVLNALAPECPQTQLVNVADREADVYDLLCAERAPNVALLVRASQDRVVAGRGEVGRLRATVAAQPVGLRRSLEVPRQEGRPARTAQVWVRWAQVTLQPPAARRQEGLPPVTVWAVWAHEEAPPAGVAALDWLLLGTLPVADQEQAAWYLDTYSCRFVIESWHKVLKSGCAIEARQLASRDALARALALYSVVAWRVLFATLLVRSSAQVPCTVLLEEAEWQALYCRMEHTTQLPAQPPSVGQAVGWLATLGGYLGRRGDGPPGPTVLWRGFQHLAQLTALYEVFAPPPPVRRKCG